MSSSASALRYWERRQEVASNNLANVSTDGFKAERVFARLLDGTHTELDAATDFRTGQIRPTGNTLDLALEGQGFLVVQTPAGERLTRGGAFRFDEAHRVVDAHGNPLLTEDGPLTIPKGGTVAIDKGGQVTVDGHPLTRLRMEQVAPNAALQHAGAGLYLPDASRASLPVAARTLHQGALEESNVDAVGAMVDMIDVQRAYASVQKAVTTLDSARQIVTTELGKPM